jgi:hypothetical protein
VQRLIAGDWPARLWFGVVPLVVPAGLYWYIGPLPWVLSHWLNAVLFTGLLTLAWCLGWFAAVIPGWLLLGPLYHFQGLRNGAPYRVGENVRVLVGRQRGRVAPVYEVCAERDRVRVDLGREARERAEDVFSYSEVCRTPDTPN